MIGSEEVTTPKLADLQSEVEAVHAKWFDGDAAEAGAVLTTGAGPVSDVGPVGFKVIEAACSGRHAEKFLQWWSGDYSAWKGDPSDGDWFCMNEAAYQLVRLGLDGPTAAADLEQTARGGPWRVKWDSARPGTDDDGKTIRTTILGLLIGKVLKRQRKRAAAGPDFNFDEEIHPNETPADETIDQKVARLERQLAQARTVIATQAPIIRNERAARLAAREADEVGKRAADELVRAMFDTIAIPDKQMNARTKLVSLVLAREAASRNSRGIFNMANATLARLTGLTDDVVSQIMQDLPAREGTPFERIVTSDWVEVSPGVKEPRSIAQVRITTPEQTTVSVIRALPAIGGPSDREEQRRAKDRARAIAAAEAKIRKEAAKRVGWGWCADHDNDAVNVKGYCPDCGEVVGERTMSVEEFRALNPNPEIQDSETQVPLPTVVVVTSPPGFRDSEMEPTPIRPTVTRAQPWRCSCGCYERSGSRCDGCNAPVAMMGAEV